MHSYLEALDAIAKSRTSGSKLEGQRLDFKTEKSTVKETFVDLAEAAVCFANSVGGAIVVGVSDGGTGPQAFVGTALGAETVRERINSLTEPSLLVDVVELEHSGQRLLVIAVPEGIDVHSTSKGSHTRRLGDACLPMRSMEVARLSEERRGVDWSARSSGRAVAEVDPSAQAMMLLLLRAGRSDAQIRMAELNLLDLLRELNLVCDDDTMTHAGELLLCSPVLGAQHEVLVYQHRQTRSGEADYVRRWNSPILIAFTEAMEIIGARLSILPVTTRSGQQVNIEDFPQSAIREALANALIHGDLRDKRPVQVEHSPETLIVVSPGPLVSGITPQNILTRGSRPRFPLLAKAMRALGLAEELGQGVDRMFREMIRSGRATPRVYVNDAEPAETVIEFPGGPPDIRLAKFIAELPLVEQRDTDALLITLLLCSRRTATAKDVAPVIQREEAQSEEVLRRLAHGDAEILEPTTGTAARRHPNYRLRGAALAALGNAVSYGRRNPSETERKVVDHVRDYDTINSATIQRMFDVDVYQARDILRDLVGREILIRVSEQRRGTAVKYGAGPKFPTKTKRKRWDDDAGPDGDALF